MVQVCGGEGIHVEVRLLVCHYISVSFLCAECHVDPAVKCIISISVMFVVCLQCAVEPVVSNDGKRSAADSYCFIRRELNVSAFTIPLQLLA